jgi:hypothetical protein
MGGATLPPGGTSAIDRYMAEFDAALRGPRAAKRDLLAEVHDALTDAADAYASEGYDPDAAQGLAVAEFGEVERLRAAYQAELGLAQARRTAALILVIMLVQPFAWANASLFVGEVESSAGSAGPWYSFVSATIEWLGWGSIAGAGAVWLAAGIGVRRIGVRRELARATGIFAAGMAAGFVLLGIALTLLSPDLRQLIDAGALFLLGAFLLAPMTAVAVSARSCLAAA